MELKQTYFLLNVTISATVVFKKDYITIGKNEKMQLALQ